MTERDASWEEIAEFIQDAAQQMREFGLSVLDVEHGGSRVRIKIDAPKAVRVLSEEPIVVHHQASAPAPTETGGTVITAPMIGTFYASPSPGEPPFVQEGDPVEAGQVVGIIEAMKIMNEITSDIDGVILRSLAQNAQAVEYGQPLFEIRPND